MLFQAVRILIRVCVAIILVVCIVFLIVIRLGHVQSVSMPNIQQYLHNSSEIINNANGPKFELIVHPEQAPSAVTESIANYCYQVDVELDTSTNAIGVFDSLNNLVISSEYDDEWESLTMFLKTIISPVYGVSRQLDQYTLYRSLKQLTGAQIGMCMNPCRIINVYGDRGIGM